MQKEHMKKYIVPAIILVVVAGASFYGGTIYGKTSRARGFAAGLNGQFGGNQNMAQRFQRLPNMVSGEIISKDDNSVTIKLPNDRGSRIIMLSGNTKIEKSVSGTKNDLSVGTTISASGKSSDNGTVDAQTVQIRPAGEIPAGGQAQGIPQQPVQK